MYSLLFRFILYFGFFVGMYPNSLVQFFLSHVLVLVIIFVLLLKHPLFRFGIHYILRDV